MAKKSFVHTMFLFFRVGSVIGSNQAWRAGITHLETVLFRFAFVVVSFGTTGSGFDEWGYTVSIFVGFSVLLGLVLCMSVGALGR